MKKQNLANLLDKFTDDLFFNIHTIQPGKIVTFYGHTEKKVKVQPLIKIKDNKNNIYQIDPIDNVPIIFPIVAGFELKFPLKKDDGCLLLFSELQLGNYLNSSNGLIVEADDASKFELTDCIAIPGLYPFKSVPISPETSIEIDDTKNIIIKTTLGKIKIEPSGNITFDEGTEPYVLGNTLNTWIISTLLTIFNTHTHSGVEAGSSDTGTPNSSLTAPINYLSQFIKGK